MHRVKSKEYPFMGGEEREQRGNNGRIASFYVLGPPLCKFHQPCARRGIHRSSSRWRSRLYARIQSVDPRTRLGSVSLGVGSKVNIFHKVLGSTSTVVNRFKHAGINECTVF